MADKPDENADTTDGNISGAKKGKKGKSKGKGKEVVPASAAGQGPPATLSPEQQEKLRKAMELLNLQSQAKNEEEATKKSYQFWSTQPVPAIDEVVTTNECISEDVPTLEVG